MKVLIIEDEAPALRRLEKLLLQTRSTMHIAGTADSVESAVALIKKHPDADLLLMDIELADGKSFAIFEQTEVKQPVIFTTAYDEYAIQAFKVNSIDYLLKPIQADELNKAVSKYETLQAARATTPLPDMMAMLQHMQQAVKQYRSRFLVKTGTRLIALPVEEIAYFTAHEKVVFVVKWDGTKYIVDYTLDELEHMLDERLFYRVNRQFIAHLKSVNTISTSVNGKLKLHLQPEPFSAEEVHVSRDKAQEFKDWLDQ
jgi:two-component system LytT family response regulator